ncbi:MAG: SurA N-terminal domain-containing protein [Verrucomicrobiota bacterium]
MVNLIRRFQQPLLVTLTILVIIAFVVLYGGPGARLDRLGADNIGKIYDRNVSAAEYRSIQRQFEITRMLGMFDLIIPLAQNARTMQEAVDNYVWNTLVIRHEAKTLGLAPTENQIADAIQHLPAFQNKGKYDHSRYTSALQTALSPRGMGAEQFEELIRDSIRVQSIKDAIGASSTPAPDELAAAYRKQYQKVEASVVRFSKEEIAKTINLTDEDLQKTYEARKETLKTAEKRKVEFVLFPRPTADKDGKHPDSDIIQKIADKASDFGVALLEANAKFEDVAKRFEVEVKSTGLFSTTDRVEELGNQPQVAAAAFQLTPEKPFSEAIGSSKGYFVLHLLDKETQPARPLSFEESKEQLKEGLKSERTKETLSLKATEGRNKIEDAVKAGKSFQEAAEAAGLKAEKLEPFSRAESKLTGSDASLIQNTAVDLQEGQISTAQETADGMVIIHVSKRLPIDPAEVENKKTDLSPMLETQRTDGLLGEWLERQRAGAGIQLNQGR